ncbi:hypothetical protein Tco_0404498 [Tanacetum coccineum]
MATEPNQLRRDTIRRLRQELVADVELANNLLHELNRYLEQLRTRAPEMLKVEALPDDPLIKYGFSALERASNSDMTNSANMKKKKLGNGADTYFWEDLWHEDMVLKQRYPRLYALEVKKTVDVASKLSQENLTWSFRRAPRSGVEQDQLTDLTTYVEGVVLVVTPVMWFSEVSKSNFDGEKLWLPYQGLTFMRGRWNGLFA